VDHVIYKQRAYVLIDDSGNEECRKAVSVDHTGCRLGKWYNGHGAEVFGGTAAFRSLLEPHSKVHECVHQMVGYLDQNWARSSAVQDEIFNALDCAEKASQDVMTVLDRVVAEKHPHMVKAA
jgi:hypothetical protein